MIGRASWQRIKARMAAPVTIVKIRAVGSTSSAFEAAITAVGRETVNKFKLEVVFKNTDPNAIGEVIRKIEAAAKTRGQAGELERVAVANQ